MSQMRPNHEYWRNRPGDAYRKTHDLRISRGMTNYAAQENWLAGHLKSLLVEKKRPLRLLDFGCGYGRIAHLCASIGDIDYHGFDFSSAMVEPLYAKPPLAYAADIRERVLVAASADGLFEAQSFDVVLTISVFIHNDEPDARRLFDILARLRRPGGEIILIENRLAPRTVMVNTWHGGCWSHDFSSFADEKMNLVVDQDVHPEHAAYVFSDRSGTPRFVRREAGVQETFGSRDALLADVNAPQSHVVSPDEDILSAATSFDRHEQSAEDLSNSGSTTEQVQIGTQPLRQHSVNRIGFMGRHFLMNAISDNWGIDDVVVSEIKKNSYGETEALGWWLAMLDREAPSVFFDIGSYTGLYSLVAAASNTIHRTVAIEASVITHGRLVQNILLNGFDLRIVPCHLAVSNRQDIAKLGHAFGVLSMASGESLEPTYEIDHLELVPAVSLDALVLQTGAEKFGSISSSSAGILPVKAIGGMKIDVEGVEATVLDGARELIRQFKPPMIIEILEPEKLALCEDMLLSAGYLRLAECTGQNYVYCHEAEAERLRLTHARLLSEQTPAMTIGTVLSYSL